jgi:hypothetical protein
MHGSGRRHVARESTDASSDDVPPPFGAETNTHRAEDGYATPCAERMALTHWLIHVLPPFPHICAIRVIRGLGLGLPAPHLTIHDLTNHSFNHRSITPLGNRNGTQYLLCHFFQKIQASGMGEGIIR